MKKQDLVLLIVHTAIADCENHVTRLQILNILADTNKQPVRFSGNSSSFWLFSIGKIDLKYEVDLYGQWHVTLV